MLFRIETDAHVQYDVRMPQLVQQFDFFDEVLEGLTRHPSLAKLFHCNSRSIPFSLEDITESTTAEQRRRMLSL